MTRPGLGPFFDARAVAVINPLLATPTGARALHVRGRLSTEEES